MPSVHKRFARALFVECAEFPYEQRLNGLYLSKAKKWVVVDARGNTRDVNAQFKIDIPQLAFSMDGSAGEFLYETIFTSPFRHVVERLKKYTNRKDFGADVPKPVEQ